MVTTLAGTAGNIGSTDGTGSAARFNYPSGLAVDAAGNVYVVDTRNDTIRKITPAGVVTTLGGSPGFGGTNDGTGSAALFNFPYGVGTDPAGNLYIADTSNNTVRRGAPRAPAHDFNGDTMADLIYQNKVTGDRTMRLMNGTTELLSIPFYIPAEWTVAGTGDFNGDGQIDILWQNKTTGDISIWLMDGIYPTSAFYLGTIPLEWKIAAVADFNADGKPDLLWQNTLTGDRLIWLMDGLYPYLGVGLGQIPIEWDLAGVGDFNGDGKPDLVWQNKTTGDRLVWLMDGTTPYLA